MRCWYFGLLLLVGCLAVQPYSAQAGPQVKFVIIDKTEPAYTVFLGIPKNLPEQKLEEIREIAKDKGAAAVSWQDFEADTDRYLRPTIVKDEYPESETVKGLVELIKKLSGTPVGLTWNGGIAITSNDYKTAKRGYTSYLSNKDEYERTRNRDPKADPLNPEGHLGPLLGR